MEIFLILLTGISLVHLFIIIVNLVTSIYLKPNKSVSIAKCSILIPARNEEKNIGGLVEDLSTYNSANFEIIVLDDNSSDNTLAILEYYRNLMPNLKVISGSLLPVGWGGKNWACHQLAMHASTDKLLFLDADVRVSKDALYEVLNEFEKHNYDLLSIFPKQTTISFGEKLLVPLINWVLLGFLPIILINKLSYPFLSAANGQVLLFKRSKYLEIGGHEKIKDRNVEDLALARNIKRFNGKLGIKFSKQNFSCRMYDNFQDAFKGLSRSLFGGFNKNYIVFLTTLIFYSLVFLLPLSAFINEEFLLVLMINFVSYFIFLIKNNSISLFQLVTYPVKMISILFLAISSLYLNHKKKVIWKNRNIHI